MGGRLRHGDGAEAEALQVEAAVQRSGVFANCDAHFVAQVRARLQSARLEAGEQLILRGEVSEDMAFVLRGTLEVLRGPGEGEEGEDSDGADDATQLTGASLALDAEGEREPDAEEEEQEQTDEEEQQEEEEEEDGESGGDDERPWDCEDGGGVVDGARGASPRSGGGGGAHSVLHTVGAAPARAQRGALGCPGTVGEAALLLGVSQPHTVRAGWAGAAHVVLLRAADYAELAAAFPRQAHSARPLPPPSVTPIRPSLLVLARAWPGLRVQAHAGC